MRPIALLLLTCLLLAACDSSPFTAPAPADPPEEKVTLRDLRPAKPITPPTPLETKDAHPVLVTIDRLDARLDADLSDAWAQVDTSAFSKADLQRWRTNGLRVGTVPLARLAKFSAALPPLVAHEKTRLFTGTGMAPLPVSVTLSRTSDAVVPDEQGKDALFHLTGGTLRFLARFTPQAGGTIVELVPQHHVSRMTLEVRQPEQIELDGDIFRGLALAAPVGSGEVLVVGLWPLDSDREPVRAADAASRPADAPPVFHSTLPPRLGPLLMSADNGGTPIQRIIVITAGR